VQLDSNNNNKLKGQDAAAWFIETLQCMHCCPSSSLSDGQQHSLHWSMGRRGYLTYREHG